jgi:hypothetical protein
MAANGLDIEHGENPMSDDFGVVSDENDHRH